jgi:chromosome condensin MukBEF MukE localization factor
MFQPELEVIPHKQKVLVVRSVEICIFLDFIMLQLIALIYLQNLRLLMPQFLTYLQPSPAVTQL